MIREIEQDGADYLLREELTVRETIVMISIAG